MSETTVLVVANRTAATPAMLHEVHSRRETSRIAVMVPPELGQWGPVEGFPGGWTPKEVPPAAIAGFGNY